MKNDLTVPTRIPAQQVGKSERWQLPEMGEALSLSALLTAKAPVEPVRVVEEEIPAETVTLAEAEKIREQAYQEGFSQGRREGFEQGQAEGLEQGLSEGRAAAKTELDVQLQQLSQLQAAFRAPLQAQEQQLEQVLVGLVEKLAEAVVRAELRSRPELLVATLHESLALLPQHAGAIEVRVHPDDIAALEHLAEEQNLHFIADDALTPGGCYVRTDQSRIDARIETRFARLAQQLQERLLSHEPDADDSASMDEA